MRRFRLVWFVFSALGLVALSHGWSQDLAFEKRVLDPQIGKVCYAVIAADVDGDGKIDPVAISEREAFWFRNPDWKKHTIISDAVPTDHVCITAADFDRDGEVDFALGAGWPRNGGQLYWLQRSDSLDKPWHVHTIGAEGWTHRMRVADVLGRGSEQLVVTPLNGSEGSGIRLLAFPVPADPVAGPWVPIVLDGSLNRAHNHWHWKDEASGNVRTLVASQEGLNIVDRHETGFRLTPVSAGASGEKPTSRGSGEVKLGALGSQSLLAAIEPMHGNQVVAYVGQDIDQQMRRVVLDDTFTQGHAVWCADFDDDGRDEIVAAHREATGDQPPGIYIYRSADESGQSWTRQLLDAPMACEDVWCADFDGDGRVDILAGGRSTHDVNLYFNRVEN